MADTNELVKEIQDLCKQLAENHRLENNETVEEFKFNDCYNCCSKTCTQFVERCPGTNLSYSPPA